MGHYNTIVFSGSQLNRIGIWEETCPILKGVNIDFSTVDKRKLHQNINLIWPYEKEESSSPFGEISLNIKKIKDGFHLIIRETDTFRIFRSKHTLNKFIDLSLKICVSCNFKYGIYWEESFDGKEFVGDLNSVKYILSEKYYSGYACGVIIIDANEIDFDSAQLLVPKNSELSFSDSGYYVYRIYGQLKTEDFT